MRRLCFHVRSIVTAAEAANKRNFTTVERFNCELASLKNSGYYNDALHLFDEIHSFHQHLKPDHYTLSTVISACANIQNVCFGNQLHAYVIQTGLKAYSHVGNTLLSLYSKTYDLVLVKRVFQDLENPDVYSWTTLLSACLKLGDVSYACELFDSIPKKELPIWNAMITGCVEKGLVEIGAGLFREMNHLGFRHDKYGYASLLSVCSLEVIDFGRQVHSLLIKTGSLAGESVVNALLTMYFNCGMVDDAYLVFEEAVVNVHDRITYNVMIDGLLSSGRVGEGLVIFSEMLEKCLKPSDLTFVSIMGSCLDSSVGHQVHTLTIKMGFDKNTSVSNAIITMYSSCRDMLAASSVFRRLATKDLVTWNTMIASYAQVNLGRSAVLAYVEMQRVGIKPDEYTFGSLLASSEFIEVVEMIQGLAIRNGLISRIDVSNALISAYSQHRMINEAYQIFCVSLKNIISWNTVIYGLLSNGKPIEGLALFSDMRKLELRPNTYSLSILLSICATVTALTHGKQIHGYIFRFGVSSTASLGNGLVTMYAKCGVFDLSLRVFKMMREKDAVSWNAMISAYAQHGQGEQAVRCFEAMQASGVKPDSATFTTVLSACSHVGLVDDGIQIFNSMVNSYAIVPSVDHYSCIVDLLSRAGEFDEVERIIHNEYFRIHSNVWWTLFSACAAHGNLRLGRFVADILMEAENDNPSVYVLLSNIYASAGLWGEAATIRESMNENQVIKQPGRSRIGP